MTLEDRARRARDDLKRQIEGFGDIPAAPSEARRPPPAVVALVAVIALLVAVAAVPLLARERTDQTEEVTAGPVPDVVPGEPAHSGGAAIGGDGDTWGHGARASQAPADAARDGVVPAIAALSVEERVEERSALTVDGRKVVLSALPRETAAVLGDDGCTIGDPSGRHGIDFVCTWEWGEVLLMDGDRIERAWPMPTVKPTWMTIDGDVIYIGSTADGAQAASTIGRVNRTTLELELVVAVHDPQLDVTLLPWLSGWRQATAAEGKRFDDLVVLGDPTPSAATGVTGWVGSTYVDLDGVRNLFPSP